MRVTIWEGTGAGIGIFLQYLGQALPVFLIILAVVGGVVLLLRAVAHAVEGSVGNTIRNR